MMRIPFSYIWRSLWARRITTALIVGGVALVVFVFAGVLMLARGLEAALIETGSPDNVSVLRRSATSELSSQIDRATADVLEVESGVARGAEGRALLSREVVLVIDLYKKKSNALGNVSIRGVSPRALELRPGVHIVQGRPFQFGTHEVVVGKGIATLFKGVALGAELAFGGDRWTVVGIADAGGTAFDSEIWGDVDQFMQAFGRPVYSSVTFRLAQPGGFDQLKARLQADPRMQYVELKHERDYYQEQSKTLATFIRTLGIIVTTIFSFGAMIGAMITMYAAVANRTVEVGTLRALGLRRRSVLGAFLLESVMRAFGAGTPSPPGSPQPVCRLSSCSWKRSPKRSVKRWCAGERRPVPTCSPARGGRWWVRPPAGSRRSRVPTACRPGSSAWRRSWVASSRVTPTRRAAGPWAGACSASITPSSSASSM